MHAHAIHHVAINVDDVQAALRFYVDVLGAEVRQDRPDFPFDGAWLDIGGQQLHLVEAQVPTNLGQHFAVLVNDLDAAVAEVRARGIDCTDPRPVGKERQAFLLDPCGNRVELHEVP